MLRKLSRASRWSDAPRRNVATSAMSRDAFFARRGLSPVRFTFLVGSAIGDLVSAPVIGWEGKHYDYHVATSPAKAADSAAVVSDVVVAWAEART